MEYYRIPLAPDDDLEEKFILFRPLLGLAFIGNSAMAGITEALLTGQPASYQAASVKKVRRYLDSIGFLADDPAPPSLPVNGNFAPTHAVLLLTNRCQLRCIYCYAAAGEWAPEELSVDTGKAAIDIVHRNAVDRGRKQFSLSFHGGGEPTMAWDVIKACTGYARGKDLPVHINITSNGIWSEAQANWILKHLDSVSLSMDGSPAVQDRNRPLADGSPSSQIVARTLKKLDENKMDYSIRMTAIEPWMDLPESIRYLCEHTNTRGIQVEPAFNVVRGQHVNPDEEQAEGFIAAYLAARQIAKQYGKKFRYSAARASFPTRVFCTAPYNTLVVNPQNEIVACYEVTGSDHPLAPLSRLGRMRSGQVDLLPGAREHLLQVIDDKRESCRDCFCYWSCAGDCYTRTLTLQDGKYQAHTVRCRINRELTRELLLEKIAEGDGVARLFPAPQMTS